MARRPRRSHVAAARKASKALRFTADYDHVETMTTTTYKEGTTLISLPDAVRRGALAAGKAVEVSDGE